MNKLLQFALDNPGTTSWHISPTMQDARAAYSAAAITLAEKVRKTLPNRGLTLNNGSAILFVAYDMGRVYQRLMGENLDAVFMDRVTVDAAIGPMLYKATIFTN
jgi:hypothetical protein